MDTWQPATLCWSISKYREFERCRRAYFYNRFWGQDPKTSYQLYKLRMITTLPELRGEVVHSVITEMLRSIKTGQAISLDAAKERVTDLLRQRFIESAKRLWHRDNRPPGRRMCEFTNLFEHYYKFPDAVERVREARLIARSSLDALTSSQLWSEIVSSGPSKWSYNDEDTFQSLDLDGIQVYTKIDFAHTNGIPTIIDWKTGEQTDQDREQLMVYALYAKSRWDWNPTQVQLSAVYLYPEFTTYSFTPEADDLLKIERLIKTSFEKMLRLESAHGPANIDLFPPTENTAFCQLCRFREICSASLG